MPAPFDLAVTDELLATTRAVRKRLDLARPVPRDVLLDCVRLAQQAPTGSNSQGWRWLLVDDAGSRRGLAALYKKAADAYLELARARLTESDEQTARVYDSAFWLVEHLAEVPVHVIPCLTGRAPEGPNDRGRQLLRLDLPGGLELPARAAQPRARLGAHHAAPRARARGGGAARPRLRRRHASRAASRRVHEAAPTSSPPRARLPRRSSAGTAPRR